MPSLVSGSAATATVVPGPTEPEEYWRARTQVGRQRVLPQATAVEVTPRPLSRAGQGLLSAGFVGDAAGGVV